MDSVTNLYKCYNIQKYRCVSIIDHQQVACPSEELDGEAIGKLLCNWNVPVVSEKRNDKSIMLAIKLLFFPSPFSEVGGGCVGKKKKIAPCQVRLHLAGSIYLRSKNKEIAASLLPWAWRNKQSIFAPGDPREDAHINHPACTCPKNQPQSPVSSRLGSRCCWGSPSSLNQCARGHLELWWHSW